MEYLKEWGEYMDDFNSGDIQKQIAAMCKLITEFKAEVSVVTRNGRIYVYLNNNHAFDTNANMVGANTVLSYLSGVAYGLSMRK